MYCFKKKSNYALLSKICLCTKWLAPLLRTSYFKGRKSHNLYITKIFYIYSHVWSHKVLYLQNVLLFSLKRHNVSHTFVKCSIFLSCNKMPILGYDTEAIKVHTENGFLNVKWQSYKSLNYMYKGYCEKSMGFSPKMMVKWHNIVKCGLVYCANGCSHTKLKLTRIWNWSDA